jgi:hypothetical protein
MNIYCTVRYCALQHARLLEVASTNAARRELSALLFVALLLLVLLLNSTVCCFVVHPDR